MEVEVDQVQPLIDLLKEESEARKRERLINQGLDDDDDKEGGDGTEKDGAAAGSNKPQTMVDRINDLLRKAGVEKPESTSRCMRAGLAKGHYGPFTGKAEELDVVVWKGPCAGDCGKQKSATIRQLLQQPDYGGNDYEDGGESAVVQCKNCCGTYVTGLCDGKPEGDSGKVRRRKEGRKQLERDRGDLLRVEVPIVDHQAFY